MVDRTGADIGTPFDQLRHTVKLAVGEETLRQTIDDEDLHDGQHALAVEARDECLHENRLERGRDRTAGQGELFGREEFKEPLDGLLGGASV